MNRSKSSDFPFLTIPLFVQLKPQLRHYFSHLM